MRFLTLSEDRGIFAFDIMKTDTAKFDGRFISNPRRSHFFSLQWHITKKCDQKCVHCYMSDEESPDELNTEDCKKVIDDFSKTVDSWKIPGRIIFTGGDPLLREDLFELLRYVYGKGHYIQILGNPNHINKKIVKKLRESGVKSYQLSLDGNEKVHDMIRGKGNFKKTIKALHYFKNTGIRTVLISTVSNLNIKVLPEVAKIASREGADVYNFSRLVPQGSGREIESEMVSPEVYREFLIKMLDVYENKLKDSKTLFGKKENLWALLYMELGRFSPKQDDIIYDGCSVGMSHLCILNDGTVYPCRRLPIKIGKVPEQKIRDIFINSLELNKMRDISKYEKCNNCKVFHYCRGCRGIVYAVTGNLNSPDPQCWRK